MKRCFPIILALCILLSQSLAIGENIAPPYVWSLFSVPLMEEPLLKASRICLVSDHSLLPCIGMVSSQGGIWYHVTYEDHVGWVYDSALVEPFYNVVTVENTPLYPIITVAPHTSALPEVTSAPSRQSSDQFVPNTSITASPKTTTAPILQASTRPRLQVFRSYCGDRMELSPPNSDRVMLGDKRNWPSQGEDIVDSYVDALVDSGYFKIVKTHKEENDYGGWMPYGWGAITNPKTHSVFYEVALDYTGPEKVGARSAMIYENDFGHVVIRYGYINDEVSVRLRIEFAEGIDLIDLGYRYGYAKPVVEPAATPVPLQDQSSQDGYGGWGVDGPASQGMCTLCFGNKEINCRVCGGVGHLPSGADCTACRNTGKITCTRCNGTGKQP